MDHLSHSRFVRLIRQAMTVAAQEGLDDCRATLRDALAMVPEPEVLDPRHVARKLGTFTITEFQENLGVSRPSADNAVRKMVGQGIIQDTGLRRKHGGPGRPAPVYEYVRVVENRPRPKREPVEVEAAREMAPIRKRRSVAPTGRKGKITDPGIRELVDAVRKEGWSVDKTGSGHIIVRSPNGNDTVSLPFTPSDHRAVLNCRSQLRRAGVKV